MVLLSYEFACCFVIFFMVYWACYRSIRLQNTLLIIASLAFLWSWQWQSVVSVLGVWLLSQVCVLAFTHISQPAYRRVIVAVGLIGLVLQLCFVKYANFSIAQLNDTLLNQHNLNPLDIIVPLGISFYTFQAISYVVDVYQGKIKPLPSSVLLGFLAFLPTLSSGPIFRAVDAKKQWCVGHRDNALPIHPHLLGKPSVQPSSQHHLANAPSVNVQSRQTRPKQSSTDTPHPRRYVLAPYLALTLLLFAVFKKIVLAGWLETIWVTPVFNNPLQFNGLEVLTAVYAYSLQLFFDFSGYTDLVMALGLLLGFRLPENFNRPYLAVDIQDFWNRWHITLSTWIRDYLYIPLGGGRRSFWRVQLNVLLAFALSGVWHGAGWNFLIWGLLHGVALVWLNVMKPLGLRHSLTKHAKPLAIFITFHYVALGWIFFHSLTFEQGMQVLQGLTQYHAIPFSLPVLPTVLSMLLAWLLYPFLGNVRQQVATVFAVLPWWGLPILLALYVVLIFSIAPQGLPGFIYANF